MNICRLFGFICFVALISGCVSAYKVPGGSSQTSSLTFSREGVSQGLGDNSLFLKVNDSFQCKPGQGVISQKKMAASKDNNISLVTNTDAITVESVEKFRMMARNVDFSGVVSLYEQRIQMCDVLVAFETEPEKSYEAKLLIEGSGSCALQVFEKNIDGQTKKVQFSEYKTC